MVRICVREVSLTLVSYIHSSYMYVVPPMTIACVLQQRIKYYCKWYIHVYTQYVCVHVYTVV